LVSLSRSLERAAIASIVAAGVDDSRRLDDSPENETNERLPRGGAFHTI
jgi:hypothetical protein